MNNSSSNNYLINNIQMQRLPPACISINKNINLNNNTNNNVNNNNSNINTTIDTNSNNSNNNSNTPFSPFIINNIIKGKWLNQNMTNINNNLNNMNINMNLNLMKPYYSGQIIPLYQNINFNMNIIKPIQKQPVNIPAINNTFLFPINPMTYFYNQQKLGLKYIPLLRNKK